MHSFSSVLLLLLAAYPALATIHTQCYKHVLKTRGCVPSAADDRVRCDPDDGGIQTQREVGTIRKLEHNQKVFQKSDDGSLERRYVPEPSNTTFIINDGPGICGDYSTKKPGGCLWVGQEQVYGNDTKTAGWLNGAYTSNCHKEILVSRPHKPKTQIRVRLMDGCTFYTFNLTVGCFQIALTEASFYDMKPTKKEIAQGYLDTVEWNFDNLDGKKSRNGPV